MEGNINCVGLAEESVHVLCYLSHCTLHTFGSYKDKLIHLWIGRYSVVQSDRRVHVLAVPCYFL
jgi:hypothetical protein